MGFTTSFLQFLCVKTLLNVAATKTQTMVIIMQEEKIVRSWLHLQTIIQLLVNQTWYQ